MKKEQHLPDEMSDSGLSGIQNGCSPEQKQQVLLGDFPIFWESTCFAALESVLKLAEYRIREDFFAEQGDFPQES